jgi:hypothetical protein
MGTNLPINFVQQEEYATTSNPQCTMNISTGNYRRMKTKTSNRAGSAV